jgi:hypothetical protein
MTKDEALKLALDWLEGGNFVYPTELRTAIKEALAQPEQKLWLGLTDEEVIEISHLALSRVQAVLMTAAKLKEKNT